MTNTKELAEKFRTWWLSGDLTLDKTQEHMIQLFAQEVEKNFVPREMKR